MAATPSRSFVDRPAARLLALGVIGLCVAALVYFHRDDIWPPPAEEVGAAAVADDPAARCLAERYAEIEAMVEEGVVGPEQARLFKSRAAAFCEAQQAAGAGSGLGAPGPGLPSPDTLTPAAPGGIPAAPPGAVRPPGG